MGNQKRTELLVYIAKLYYEYGYSQNMIAEKLDLSRPYISKLLNEAKECGIVTVQIHDPLQAENALEKELRDRFQLRKAILAPPSQRETALSYVGRLTARYVESIIESDDIVGVSWGNTMYSTSLALVPQSRVKNAVFMQICAGVSNLENNTYAAEIIVNFANAFSGIPYSLPLPAVVDDVKVKRAILKDHNIRKVMEYGFEANIALFTMGAFGQHNALQRAGYISAEKMQELSRAGAVGDVCSHIIDIDGNICDFELDARTIAVPLEDIKRKEYRVAAVTGMHKLDCTYAALKSGIANVLVSDEQMAISLLKYK